MDKSGNIHWFRLNNLLGKWEKAGAINDREGSAPEGLMSIASDNEDNFYTAWLDTRSGDKNQVYFSMLSGNSTHWSKNILAYQSPDGHVCECCKPSISVQGSQVAIMFRNWLGGSRDLYLLQSSDKGRSFKGVQKLGMGTWKLNGCPMDGGGVVIDRIGNVQTVWQREGVVYYCKPGQPEIEIDRGRTCSITGTAENTIITLERKDTLKLVKLPQRREITIGNGGFLKSIVMPDNTVLCVWEQDNVIKFKKV